MFFLDSSLLIAAGASFVAGVMGYIIARLWIKPIVSYNITKRKLDSQLNRYLAQMPEGPAAMNESNDSSAGGDALGMARKMAMKLLSHYNDEIPYWYRLFLDSRQESPTQASGLLTNLRKIKDPQKRRSRIEAAKKELKLHGKKTTRS
jgi:hypothetical protein